MSFNDCLAEFIFHCQCRKLSPKTISNYQKQITYLINYLQQEHHVTSLEEVKAQHLKQFLMKMTQKGRTPAYVNDLLKAFKVFFRYLANEDYCTTHMIDKVKNVKQPKVIIHTFSEKEIKKMLDYHGGNDYLSIRNRTILALFFDTGIRLNELITLCSNQIFDDYFLIHGKGDKERVVPKSPYLAKCLFKYLRVRESYFEYKAIPYDNIFLSKNGKPLTSEAVERMIRVTGEAVGVQNDVRISPHTCRHTYAQLQLKNGIDIYSLARLLGHENISITQRYLEGIRDRSILEAGKKTSPLMNL